MKGAKMVTDLDEGLDLAALGQLLRTHTLRYLEGVTLDAGDDGVGVGSLFGTLIVLLDHDDLRRSAAETCQKGQIVDSSVAMIIWCHDAIYCYRNGRKRSY